MDATCQRVSLSGTSKTSLTVSAYSGAGTITVLASAVQGTASVVAHPAPAAVVSSTGSTVVRYWVDKVSATHAWTVPTGVTRRASTTGAGGGLLASVTADTGGVPAGTVTASVATSSLASAKALAWTIVVPPV